MNDLSEQNDVLVSTLEELEKEARERVNLLEKELKKASSSSKVGTCTSQRGAEVRICTSQRGAMFDSLGLTCNNFFHSMTSRVFCPPRAKQLGFRPAICKLYIILKVASFATIVEHPWSISHLSNIDSRFLIFAYDGLLKIRFSFFSYSLSY